MGRLGMRISMRVVSGGEKRWNSIAHQTTVLGTWTVSTNRLPKLVNLMISSPSQIIEVREV